jgi:hypothetical protein
MSYEFPKDEMFRIRAAKLADAVQKAIGDGVKIKPLGKSNSHPGCCCPLGTVSPVPYPPSGTPCGIPLSYLEMSSFMCGFESPDGPRHTNTDTAWFELGRAYRARFPG